MYFIFSVLQKLYFQNEYQLLSTRTKVVDNFKKGNRYMESLLLSFWIITYT